MLTIERLNKMKQADIRTVDMSQFTDIREVEIDEKTSVKKRIVQYIEKVHNPFLIKIGDYGVKFSYAATGEGMEERMLAYVNLMTGINSGNPEKV